MTAAALVRGTCFWAEKAGQLRRQLKGLVYGIPVIKLPNMPKTKLYWGYLISKKQLPLFSVLGCSFGNLPESERGLMLSENKAEVQMRFSSQIASRSFQEACSTNIFLMCVQ